MSSGANAAEGSTRGGAGEPAILHFENVPLFPKNFRV